MAVSVAFALDVIITGSAVTALAWRAPSGAAGGPAASALVADRRMRWSGHPAASLALVTALIYLNQVLFTVYVVRVRHGDVSFIARYLPAGWFALAHWGVLTALARHFPVPGLLAPTVLRVQAFLELPFVIFGYLTACRWFGVFDRARRLVWPASIAWTATFCLIEWSLRNPFTLDDLVIRAVSMVVVPFWVLRLPRADDDTGATGSPARRDPLGLLVAAVSVAALGGLILVVYDTALLYNLGGVLLGAVVVAAVLLAARFTAKRLPVRTPGRGVDSIGSAFGWFLVLFFVPALPIRYGIGFGTRYFTLVAGLAVLVAACKLGSREAFARSPGRPGGWLTQMLVSATAGLASAIPVAWLSRGYPETRLLLAAAAFFAVSVAVCAVGDRISSPA